MGTAVYKGSDLADQLFPDRVVYNVDGTVTDLPGDDDIVSSYQYCDICGIVFDENWKPFKRNNKTVCKQCLDKR